MKRPDELLYDSEASLRLVDHAIEELGASALPPEIDPNAVAPELRQELSEQSRALMQSFAGTIDIVARIREGFVKADAAGVDRLQQMQGRLQEISAATEIAATEILDGLDRASRVTDELDACATEPQREAVGVLRDEINGVMASLQFQDITNQQIQHLSSQLADLRNQIAEIVSITTPDARPVVARPGAFDPNATTFGVAERQGLVDRIFEQVGECRSA